MSSTRPLRPRRSSNGRLALICFGVAALMTGAAFAAVPLYKAFCQATGWNGTARRASKASDQVLDQTVRMTFDTNVKGVPWTFEAAQPHQTVHVGATSIAIFKVANNSDQPVTARAAFNITPETAAFHLRKLQCFCFNAQTLQPHQSAEFPVVYFLEPAFATDPETKGFTDVTLSYTFVPVAPEAAPGGRPIGSRAED
jgi:cytochrome c oxidase assembly protein subunit 11